MNIALIVGYAVVLACVVVARGGVYPFDWAVCAAALAGLALASEFRRSRTMAPLSRPLGIALVSLFVLVLLQAIPLPLSLIGVLSPARAEIVRATAPIAGATRFAALSNVPNETLQALSQLGGFILTVALVQRLSAAFKGRPWIAAAPLIVIALFEAVLGLIQTPIPLDGSAVSRGTYANRDHYAGLLELALPLVVMLAAYHLSGRRERSGDRSYLIGCGLLAAATTMLAAILLSFSRMGFVGALFGLAAAAMASLGGRLSRRGRWMWTGAITAVVVLAFVLLPTTLLLSRFAGLGGGNISGDVRMRIWRDAVRLAGAYPLTGCGARAFQSSFYAWQTVPGTETINFAHCDYLQALAELGIPGFVLVIAAVGFAVASSIKATGAAAGAVERFLAAGCFGSLAAILLHSLVDFNMYVPANAMAAASVIGIAGSLAATVSARERLRSLPPKRGAESPAAAVE
jgi:O-antigen ligase